MNIFFAIWIPRYTIGSLGIAFDQAFKNNNEALLSCGDTMKDSRKHSL